MKKKENLNETESKKERREQYIKEINNMTFSSYEDADRFAFNKKIVFPEYSIRVVKNGQVWKIEMKQD